MKLLNKSLIYFSVSLFFIIGLWSVVFYFSVLNEIKESVDEGLDNYKRQIVHQAQRDSTILSQKNFEEGFFSVREITQSKALAIRDRYIDTLLYMQDADDEYPELEPARLLATAFQTNGKYYELQIINPMVEEDDLIEELVYDAIWLYLLLMVCLVLINNFVLQRLWKPFYSFLSRLKLYRIGSGQNLPEVQTTTKEFADLQNAVAILLQRNIENYEQQKQFIGNASHELQTPLAIALNKLELLVENGDLQNNQAKSIAEVMDIIENLVRLNKSLLLLSKIENRQFLENQNVLLNEVVKQSVNELEEMAAFRQIEISVSEKAKLSVNMDVSLANTVVSNLLRNAIFHNVPKGKVIVEVSENALQISNTGIKSPLNSERIFSRFYKSNTAQNSTGLGLAIVKAIVDLYGFEILYRYEQDMHGFEVKFK